MKRKVFSFLLSLIGLWLIILWVFWETGHTLSYPRIKNALVNPHTIDFAEVVQTYYFPTFMVISVFLNLIAISYARAFYSWVKTGKIRIGGKAGND